MNKILLLIAMMTALSGNAQNNLNIIPMPAEVKMGKGIFNINKNTSIVLEGSGLEKIADYFNDYLFTIYGFKLKFNSKNTNPNSIVLNYERLDAVVAGAYNLTVTNKGVNIAGDNDNGVFYGIQTLIQLLPVTKPGNKNYQLSILQLSIKDYPRFRYRGMMLDVSRHFLPLSIVKKNID